MVEGTQSARCSLSKDIANHDRRRELTDENKSPEQTSVCPKCGEEVRYWQVRCRNCGELLDKSAGKDVSEPGVNKRKTGCFIVGLISLVIWLFIYSFMGIAGGYYYGGLAIGEHLIFIIPSIVYVAFLVWFIKHTHD